MIYRNGELWTGWKEFMKKFTIPSEGITYQLLNNTAKLHTVMVGERIIGNQPVLAAGLDLPIMFRMEIDGEFFEMRYSRGAVTKDSNDAMKWHDTEVQFREGRYTAKVDQSLVWFLEHHPLNRDTKGSTKKRYFYKVDARKEAAERKTKNVERTKVLQLLYVDMADGEALDMFAAINKYGAQNADIAREQLETYALKNPKTFVELYESEARSIKALITKAQSAGIIAFEPKNRFWYWVKEDQKTIEPSDVITQIVKGRSEHDDLFAYLTTKADGKAVLKMIEDELKKA
jgi:hypothetical protein